MCLSDTSRFFWPDWQGRRHGFLPGVASRSRGPLQEGLLFAYGASSFFFLVCQKTVYLQFNTCTGGGDIVCPPHLFSRISQKRYTLCANFDFPDQKIRSPGQVKVRRTYIHSGTGFKLEDGVVGTDLVRMFSNFQDEVLKWILTEYIFRTRSARTACRRYISINYINYIYHVMYEIITNSM